jgi:hypothetical protein
MVIRLHVEIWVIGRGGIKKRSRKRGGWVGEEIWGCWVLWPLCVLFLLQWSVLVSGIAGVGVVYSWCSRLFVLQIHTSSFGIG